MLSLLIHYDCKADKSLLTLRIIKFAFLSSCRMISFDNTILQLGSCFEILEFSVSKSYTVVLDMLVVASLVPTCRIKWLVASWYLVLYTDWYLQFLHLKSENVKVTMLLRRSFFVNTIYHRITDNNTGTQWPTRMSLLVGFCLHLSWRLSHCFEFSLLLLFFKDRDLRPAL